METGHSSVILVSIQLCLASMQLFSPVFNYSRHYVFVQCYSVILALCFVQSAVYILSRPSVPGKVNFLNLLEHILISKANDSVKIKPNKSSSIGMLSVWFSAPEPGIREV